MSSGSTITVGGDGAVLSGIMQMATPAVRALLVFFRHDSNARTFKNRRASLGLHSWLMTIGLSLWSYTGCFSVLRLGTQPEDLHHAALSFDPVPSLSSDSDVGDLPKP